MAAMTSPENQQLKQFPKRIKESSSRLPKW